MNFSMDEASRVKSLRQPKNTMICGLLGNLGVRD